MNSNRRLKRQICVSNATNSRSPNDLKSRIFIGNLNTSVISKKHLHILFIEFGQIRAISMHKGYAFIQYDDQMDALNAVFAQDGQLLAGQAIDVNLVTEPKPHQKSSKTSTDCNESEKSVETNSIDISESDNNCSFSNYDMIVECNAVNESSHSLNNQKTASNSETDTKTDTNIANICEEKLLTITTSEGQTKRVKLDNDQEMSSINNDEVLLVSNSILENDLVLSNKESDQRLDTKIDNSSTKKIKESCCHQSDNRIITDSLLSNTSMNICLTNQSLSQEAIPLALNQVQAYDILICGNCRTLFTSLPLFIEHKRSSKCRLRFVCHCHHV